MDICADCGTDHDGYPPDSIGAKMRCVRTRAERLGASGLVAEMDAIDARIRGPQEALVREIRTWREADR